MPGLAENHRKWSAHNWGHEGHRWSPGGTTAGTDLMWWRTIRSRIHTRLPAGRVLEIAPGFGRWTAYLIPESRHLTAVDITERCIEVCRDRFAAAGHAEFHVNDGESLPYVPDSSLDFAFSLDSLVHVEAPQLQRYLEELGRTLRPGAGAFLHHSNLGAYADPHDGRIARYVGERHWRAESMSARLFRELCRQSGLECVSQEIINWIGRDGEVDRYRLPGHHIALTDCFSICVRPDGGGARTTHVYINRRFVDEWRQLIDLTTLYARAGEVVPSPAPAYDGAAPATATAGPTVRVKRRMASVRQRLRGRVFAQREPIARALRAGHCPDCGGLAPADGAGQTCPACQVRFVLR